MLFFCYIYLSVCIWINLEPFKANQFSTNATIFFYFLQKFVQRLGLQTWANLNNSYQSCAHAEALLEDKQIN